MATEHSTMRAVWLEDGTASLREVPRPRPAADEALVRVLCVGICGTDLQLLRGYAGFRGIPGHEFVGRVIEGPPVWLGRRVVAEINVACGRCPECEAGRQRHCERRQVLGLRGRAGALAEFVAVPIANLHAVPEGMADEVATFVEPVAAALRIREQVDIDAATKLLVVGDGRLGQLVARALAATTGARPFVLGRHSHKLERLVRDGIAAGTHAPSRRYDVAVECSGSPAGLAVALAHVHPEATVVLKSTYAQDGTFDPSACVVEEIRLVGSRCGRFGPAIELLARGDLDPTSLVDARFPLEDGPRALAAAGTGALKVLVHVAPPASGPPRGEA